MPRPMPKSGRAAGLFVLLGIVTILGVTFAAGIYAGRISANRPAGVASSSAEREPSRRGLDLRTPKTPEALPRLTFYQELTAPLTAPPPPPKPAKPAPPLVTAAKRGTSPFLPEASAPSPAREGASATTLPSATPAAPAVTTADHNDSPTTGARYTVQVGAYKLRPPADALRASLAAAGHDARVVETDAPNGVRFRVQVGDFTSRDAARDAAGRLSGPTFVTTR